MVIEIITVCMFFCWPLMWCFKNNIQYLKLTTLCKIKEIYNMDRNILTYLACICFIFIFGRIFIVPLKKILKLVFNSILGGGTIFLINLVGGNFGFHIGLNFFTSIMIRFIRFARSGLFNYCEAIDGRVEKLSFFF